MGQDNVVNIKDFRRIGGSKSLKKPVSAQRAAEPVIDGHKVGGHAMGGYVNDTPRGRQKGEVRAEFEGVVTQVIDLQGQKLLTIVDALSLSGDYLLETPLMYRAGRASIASGDKVAICSDAEPMRDTAGLIIYRIDRFRFVP